MPDNVKVPGLKQPVPKVAVVAGLAGVGVAIYLYYRNKKNTAAATPAASSTGQYPPDGTVGNPADPYSTDPATGQTYGDEAAGSGTLGADDSGTTTTDPFPWDGTYGNPNDPYSMDPATGQTYGDEGGGTGGSGGGDGGTGGPPFTSNSAWSNWVIQQMESNNPNTDVGALTDALGLYISGQQVSASQQQLIFDAIAIGGDPPVAGTNGYPPKVQGDGGKGGSPGSYATNPPPGFKVTNVKVPSAMFTWSKGGATGTTGVKSYEFTLYDGGTLVDSRPGLGGASTSVTTNVLKKGRKYAAYLRALPEAPGATKAQVSFST